MTRRFIPYRRDLKPRSQALRRDPSPAERKLWYEFLRDLPAKFTRQKPLGCYVADFYCARVRLVVEVDGDSHFTDRGKRYDEGRTEAFALRGIRVIRFTNSEVTQQFEAVCARIVEALDDSNR